MVIQKGDLLHVDFGVTYMRLNSDQQQHFYMLRDGETKVPEYLEEAFRRGNRLQDILVSSFDPGKTGNEILREALETAKKEGIIASIYTHPIGLHGHAAGPTIGILPIVALDTAPTVLVTATSLAAVINLSPKSPSLEDSCSCEGGSWLEDDGSAEVIELTSVRSYDEVPEESE